MDVNEELKFLWKFKKKKIGGGGSRGGVGLVGQGGCERRIEVFVKLKKKKMGGGVGGRVGGQGGCERRIEVFEKIQKKNGGWGGRGRGGPGWWGVRVDVNPIMGVGVMWGMGDVNQE